MLSRVILVVDRPMLKKELTRALAAPDVIVESIRSRQRLWERVSRENADLIMVSIGLVPEPAVDAIRLFRELPDSPLVVVLVDAEDSEERVSLISAGADAVLCTGLPAGQHARVVQSLLSKRQENTVQGLMIRHPLSQPTLNDFISASPAMDAFLDVVRRVTPSEVSLLILGETGSGKERLARAIHAEGPRSRGPFVAVNCGALHESLLESELFGHEEGSFTGATRARRGLFEMAHRGTVFLDEVGEMPVHLQVKLLRVLQDHEIQRVGSEKPVKVDVRVVAATNRDLEDDVKARRFRQDLYFRLSVISLTIPPLRERKEDIPVLAESYLEYFLPRVGRRIGRIEPAALEALSAYAWPGNVRELMNIIERAMLLCPGDEIRLADLPRSISDTVTGSERPNLSGLTAGSGRQLPEEWLDRPFREVRREAVSQLEARYIAGLLRRTGGRVGETARLAGMEPRSVNEKMRRHGLRKEDFREGR
jgi:DNA-binding NtrC family response regulator